MSDEDQEHTTELTAEFRDGQLQIVEVTQFEKDDEDTDQDQVIEQIYLDKPSTSGEQYVQVLDHDGKGVVNLDLMNFSLVRCNSNSNSQPEYRLVSNSDVSESDGGGDESTVTCVLRCSDTEDQGDSYIVVERDSEDNSLVLMPSAVKEVPKPKHVQLSKPVMTPLQVIEKVKALQKSRILAEAESHSSQKRRRKGDLPSAKELLASPNFKLYLYSCKQCTFKCNAIKELTTHRTAEHGSGSGRWRSSNGRSAADMLQCARCPFRGNTHSQLIRHSRHNHASESVIREAPKSDDDSEQVTTLLVCGACGYESSSKTLFTDHMVVAHNVLTDIET